MTRGLSVLLALLLACPARLVEAAGNVVASARVGATQTFFAAPTAGPAAAGAYAVPSAFSLPLDMPGVEMKLPAPGAAGAVAAAVAAADARLETVTLTVPASALETVGETHAVYGAAVPPDIAAAEAAASERALPAKTVALTRGIRETVALNWENRPDAALPQAARTGEALGTESPQRLLARAELAEASVAPEPPAPRFKLSRALRIGALTGLAMFAVDMLVLAVAPLLGHTFAPSYQMPVFSDPASFSFLGPLAPVIAKFQELFIGAFLAPFNEEPYFRAGVIGLLGASMAGFLHTVVWGLSKLKPSLAALGKWVNPTAFALVAFETAVLFTVLHEMSDPVLIGLRLVQALLFSYLYVKEGIASTLSHHAVFNFVGLLLLPLVFTVVGGVTTVLWPQALAFAAAVGLAWLLLWRLTRASARAESAELAAGRLAPYRLSAKASLWLGRFGWLGVALLAGSAALSPSMEIAFLMVALALQVAPGAMAFGAYGWLLRNLERRKGPGAVALVRAPKNPYPLGNGPGWLAATTTLLAIAAFIATLVGAISLGFMSYVPSELGWKTAWLLPLPAAWLAATGARLRNRKSGIPPWLYMVSAVLNSAMLAAVLSPLLLVYMPWNEIVAALESLKELTRR